MDGRVDGVERGMPGAPEGATGTYGWGPGSVGWRRSASMSSLSQRTSRSVVSSPWRWRAEV